eukprot:GHVU01039628.1.p1 GENE.GHVU01039628.1~~GHVU01039628.1.p1  ORF type:complete len:246 (-),score=28.76 GHVU01039628.1:418-1155(-)
MSTQRARQSQVSASTVDPHRGRAERGLPPALVFCATVVLPASSIPDCRFDLQARYIFTDRQYGSNVVRTHNSNIAFEVDFDHPDGGSRFAAVTARDVKIPMLYSDVLVEMGVIDESIAFTYKEVKGEEGLLWEVVVVPIADAPFLRRRTKKRNQSEQRPSSQDAPTDAHAHGEAAYNAQPYLRWMHNRRANIFYRPGARLDLKSMPQETPEVMARYIAAELFNAVKRNRRTEDSGEAAVFEGPGQ